MEGYKMTTKKVYQLNDDGTTESEFFYTATNSYEAMTKHVYYLQLQGINVTNDDIHVTMFGHALNVGNTVYWCKG
jgi:hypothetical protein